MVNKSAYNISIKNLNFNNVNMYIYITYIEL